MFNNAVFQGVGVRAIASVGALKELEKHNFEFQTVAGVSGGSIVAALYAAGYTAGEMEQIILCEKFSFSQFLYLSDRDNSPSPNFLDLEDFKSLNLWKWIKLSCKYKKIWEKQGVYTTNKIYEWMNDLLKKKEAERFRDLKKTVDLKILAANTTKKKYQWFDRKNNPNMSIAKAVCCSVSIPFVFEPVTVNIDGDENKFIDGGILSTYPISIFRKELEETVGFKFTQPPLIQNNLPRFIKFSLNGISTMWVAHDKLIESESNFSNNIVIDTDKISSVQFFLNQNEKESLLQCGEKAAIDFYEEKLQDYQNLFDLLKKQQWLKANQKTFSLMRKFCGREETEWLNSQDIENIDCNCLNTIDRLWTRYSDGRFGFSTQKKIWHDTGKFELKISNNFFKADLEGRKLFEFSQKVGWIQPNILSINSLAPQNPQTMRDKITQALNIQQIQQGHLPNLLLDWAELSIDKQIKSFWEEFQSFSQGSSLWLTALYSRFEKDYQYN